jgi:predicted outer membrane repeat protein
MYIEGPGRDHLTISGNNASRIFSMEPCSGTGYLKLSGVTLTSGASAGYGGAVYARDCGLELLNSRITASHSQKGGGAISSNSAYGVSLDHATISGNSAPNGGAIYAHGKVSVNRSSILGNTAAYRGGGIYMATGYLTVINSTISGNALTATPALGYYRGGGIYVAGAKSLVEDSTIAYNYASDGGGGVQLHGAYTASHATFKFATIVGNSSCCYDAGNGISADAGQPLLYASIVANNFNRGGLYDLAGSFTVNSSLVRNPGSATITGSGSLFGVDPKLGPLKDNGGPTWTMLPAANSPVIDAGPACFDIYAEQRGMHRCVNGHLDMGSVERQNPEDFIFRDDFDPSP